MTSSVALACWFTVLARPPILDRDLRGPFCPRMTLEVMTLLPLQPGVRLVIEGPGLCVVTGGRSELRKIWSQIRTKGRKEGRMTPLLLPAALGLHTDGIADAETVNSLVQWRHQHQGPELEQKQDNLKARGGWIIYGL